MNDEHKICELELQLAVLRQKSTDDDKALLLAERVNTARWIGYIAIFGVVANFILTILKAK